MYSIIGCLTVDGGKKHLKMLAWPGCHTVHTVAVPNDLPEMAISEFEKLPLAISSNCNEFEIREWMLIWTFLFSFICTKWLLALCNFYIFTFPTWGTILLSKLIVL